MKNPSLLSLLPPLLAVLLPVAAAMPAVRVVMESDVLSLTATERPPYVDCIGDGVYAANSTYEANLRRVAVLLVAEASTNRRAYHTTRTVGYWPNRLLGTSFCRLRHEDDGTSCAACIAGAFLEVQRACPYRREAFFSSRNCTLQLDEYRIFGAGGIFEERTILERAMASGLIFQGIGFAWLFFLLLQEWRSRKRVTLVHSAPVSPED